MLRIGICDDEIAARDALRLSLERADFVFDGYAVGAMDYLVKPIKEDKLSQMLARARKLLECRRPQTFVVQNSEGLYRIAKKEILYLYSDKRLVKVFTEAREYSFYGKLDEAEASLGPRFCPHSSALPCSSGSRFEN